MNDNEILESLTDCLLTKHGSFFLFAGAGSGKTYTLINLLENLKKELSESFKVSGKKIAVITFTNAATDEINNRLNKSSIFHISTIHSFIWDIIKHFQKEIKEIYLKNIDKEIEEINNKYDQLTNKDGKKGQECKIKIENLREFRASKENIKEISYIPQGSNSSKSSLSHSDVISISTKMISDYDLLKELIVQKYPILLIDESQDTQKSLLEAFMDIQKKFPDSFSLGLIGDIKQRIYQSGHQNIPSLIPATWESDVKRNNYRSAKRIVELGNSIGALVDTKAAQKPREDAKDGVVRIFLAPQDENIDKIGIEDQIRFKMSEITSDSKWNYAPDVKILTLEHSMAANRLGFADFDRYVKKIDKYSQSLFEGNVSPINFFTKTVVPLIVYFIEGKNVEVMNILRAKSPLFKNLTKDNFEEVADICNQTIKLLAEVYKEGQGKVKDLLKILLDYPVFQVEPVLKTAYELGEIEFDPNSKDETELWNQILNIPIVQLSKFQEYIEDKTQFATHQGVKGLEFDRVMVLMDDKEMKGFLFNYDKAFGVKPLSATDEKNAKEGKETGLERTLRLLYVTCTRAKDSLALVYYTPNVELAKENCISKGWFKDDEIVIIR